MEKGEVQCRGLTAAPFFGREPFISWRKRNFVNVLLYGGLKRDPRIPARLFVDFALSKEGQNALINVQQIAVRPDMEQRTNPRAQGQKWFIERPDRHVNVQESIKLFREIFGIP